MNEAAEVLVIILSVFLALFLGLAIALTILLIKLTNKLRNVADHAEVVVNNVQAASSLFKNAAGPLAAGKFVLNIVDTVLKAKKKGK